MARERIVDPEILVAKRQLRAEIARTRLRTTLSIARLRDERRRLSSWRTYVARFPQAALALSFAAGLLVALGRPARRLPRMLGTGLAQWGLSVAKAGLLGELAALWNAGRPLPPGPEAP
ncbi:MAG: hypothetical protein HYX69_12455 [Planctomycetia bacterium]|nr:hypothetical protein [Planctomycetia bacterium]